jgi:NAD(P)-dependent dehydrogenase (short-subunit alcohol dehydrogenase family)
LALVTRLASDSSNVVFAGVRDTNLGDDHPLAQLVKNQPKVIQLVKISSANKEDNLAAAEVIKEEYGKVDIIIANAGKLKILGWLWMDRLNKQVSVPVINPFEP